MRHHLRAPLMRGSMMPHVVATAVEHNLPAVWVLQNNYAIGTIRDLQRVYHAYREAIRSNVPTVLDVIINRDTSQRSSRLSASARFAESTVMTPERTFTPV